MLKNVTVIDLLTEVMLLFVSFSFKFEMIDFPSSGFTDRATNIQTTVFRFVQKFEKENGRYRVKFVLFSSFVY